MQCRIVHHVPIASRIPPSHALPAHACAWQHAYPTPPPVHSKVPKKVTTCAFTADGRHMLAADKFGDVLAAATQRPEGERHAVHATHGLHGNVSNSGRSLPQCAFTVMRLTGGVLASRPRH